MKKEKELPQVEPVKIKPLFGIKPNIWVSACYLLTSIMVIFLVGFLPGIIHGSKRVFFESNAGNAAVYVDSKYVGGTPFSTRIESGIHTAEFKISNTTIDTIEFKVSHPVFLTWLFERKMSVTSEKGINDVVYEGLCKTFLEDITNYSAILTYDNVYKYPPLFLNFATSLLSYDNLDNSNFKEVLSCALAFITTNEMLSDAKEAYSLLGLNYDFADIENAILNKNFKNETERLIGLSRTSSSELTCDFFRRSGLSVNGFTFDNFPVTEAMYFYFVNENPKWAITNKDSLIEEGLVDEYYLNGVSLSSSNVLRPIRNISYYAAEAFCEWLSDITGKNVFIPAELQWTTAANFSDSDFQKTLIPVEAQRGPSGVLGGVWELTSTPYVPLQMLFDYSVFDTLEKYDVQAEVIIKGGSFASNGESLTTYSIGTAPLSLCSDFMGFRLAWR